MSARFFTWCLGVATIVVGALGLLNVMSLRFQSDAVGRHILSLERSIAESKKELEGSRRARDQAIDTLQLQLRIGDTLKPPVPEQVVWVRYFPTAPSPLLPSPASPRMTARELAFLQTRGPGGGSSR